jgi:hypothetical protein
LWIPGSELNARSDYPTNKARMCKGQSQCELATVTPADQVRVLQPELDEQSRRVFRHAFIRHLPFRNIRRVPMSHLLYGDYLMTSGQYRDLP